MRRHNLSGGALAFHEDPKADLPLRALLGRSHVKVRLKCADCGFVRTTRVEGLIAKLSATRPPTDMLMISEIRSRITGPCKTCRRSAWRVDVLWPALKGEGHRRTSPQGVNPNREAIAGVQAKRGDINLAAIDLLLEKAQLS